MENLQKLKKEYMKILDDIEEHPDHIKNYDLKEMYQILHNKKNEKLSVVETARILNLPLKKIYDMIENNKINAIKDKHIIILKGDLIKYYRD